VVLKKLKKQKRQTWERKKLQLVKKHSSYYFAVSVKSSGDISAEPARGQKVEEDVKDLDLRNDKNRRSLISSAVAEERQEISSKSTIDEIADAITGGNDIGLLSASRPIPEDMQEYWLKNDTSSLDIVIKKHA